MDGTRAILGKDHRKLYDCYLIRHTSLQNNDLNMSFFDYARRLRYDAPSDSVVPRYADRARKAAIGVNYAWELNDHCKGVQ